MENWTIKLNLNGTTELPNGYTIKVETIEASNQSIESIKNIVQWEDDWTEIIDSNLFEDESSVRLNQVEDLFKPLNFDHEVKIRKHIRKQSITSDLIPEIPVIVNSENKVLAICGVRVSDYVKVTEETKKLLKLSYKLTD